MIVPKTLMQSCKSTPTGSLSVEEPVVPTVTHWIYKYRSLQTPGLDSWWFLSYETLLVYLYTADPWPGLKRPDSDLKMEQWICKCVKNNLVFLQIAKTLFHDECLRPCPRCQHPARCHAVKREGVCSRADCSFQFCTSCLCTFHGSRECGSQSVGRRKKDTIVPGSAQSKRNVKRL